jgi:hypothetical protein
MRSRLQQRRPRAGGLGGLLDLPARSTDVELHAVGHLLASHHLGGRLQVLQTAVHAGDDVRFVDGDILLLELGDRVHGLHRVGAGDVGRHLLQVQDDLRRVHRVGVGPRRGRRPGLQLRIAVAAHVLAGQDVAPLPQVGQRDVVDGEPPHQRPPFGGHVGDGEAGVHAEAGHPVPGELHRGVEDLAMVV